MRRKLTTLTLEGFLSFADRCVLEFADGVTYILGNNHDNPKHADSNGAGKTAIPAAIVWANFGKTPVGASKNAVVNHNKDLAYVELVYSDGLTIRREQPRDKAESLTYHTGDGCWVKGRLADVQASLTEILGKFHVFCNTTYLGRSSKSVRFLDAEPAQRSAVMQEMVTDGLFQRAGELMKQDLAQQTKAKDGATIVLGTLTAREAALREKRTRIKAEYETSANAEAERIKGVKKRIADLTADYRKLEAIANEEDVDTSKLASARATIVREQKEAIGRRAELATIASLTELPPGEACPTCLRVVTEDDAIALCGVVDNAVLAIKDIDREATDRESALAEIDAALRQADVRKERKRNAERQKELVLRSLRMAKDELQPRDMKHIEAQMMETAAELNQILGQIDKTRKEIFEIEKTRPFLQVLAKAFTSEIKNFLFDRLRGGLEHYTRHYLCLLAGDAFSVSFPPQTKGGQEKFEILMRTKTHAQDLSCYSDGENWRATFAILLALRQLLTENQANPYDFVLIDDPIGALDQTGISNFVSQVRALAESGDVSQVLVTIPRRIDIPAGSNTINVVKKNNQSTAVQ